MYSRRKARSITNPANEITDHGDIVEILLAGKAHRNAFVDAHAYYALELWKYRWGAADMNRKHHHGDNSSSHFKIIAQTENRNAHKLYHVVYGGYAWRCPAGHSIDHKDRDTFNNRRSNLELSDPKQQALNRRTTKNVVAPYFIGREFADQCFANA